MKQLYVKYFFLFVLLMPSLSSYAFDVFLDGIYYNLSEKGAVIVKGDKNYSGNVIIPDSINYGGNRYQVIGVGESAFANCTELTGIEFYKGNQSGLSRVINSGKSSYFSIDDNAFNGCTSLTSIDIPAIVTTVGRYAFNGCSNLLNATFSSSSGMVIGGGVEKEQSHNGVTIIHEGAFKGCSSLLKITFPVTLKTIGENAFQDCNKLDSVTVNANIIGKESFMNCSGMTSLTITANVDSIGNRAFYGCRSLATINSSIFTPYPIPEDVFEGLPNDAVLYVPTGSASAYKATAGWNSINTILDRYAVGDTFFSSTVDSIAMTFRVTNKENKTVEVYGTYRGAGTGPGGVYYLEETFYPAIALTTGGTVTIPQTVMGHTVTGISSNAFHGCQWISAVVIPGSVTTIGDRAFEKCSKLNRVICYATTPPAIGTNVFKEKKDNVYDIITSLSAINVPSNCVDEYKSAEGWSEYASLIQEGATGGICGDNATWTFNPSTGELTISGTGEMYNFDTYTIPWKPLVNSITSVTIESGITSIGYCAFYKCPNLLSATISNTVTHIGWHAFLDCTGLTSITIPNSVTSIDDYAFSGCINMTSLLMSNNIKTISNGAFFGCISLTSVIFPEGLKSIGEQAFSGCKKINKITIPNSVSSIGSLAFSACDSLSSVYIGSGVRIIHIGGDWGTFRYCNNLKEIKVDKNNPVFDSREDCNGIIITQGDTLIFGCKSTVIPNSVKAIGDYAFSECQGLSFINIPKDVTSIGHGAFFYCKNLGGVTIPNNLKSIGEYAFWSCSNITSLTIPESVTDIGARAFAYSGIQSITLPHGITNIRFDLFRGCENLSFVSIPSSVTTIGRSAFKNCTNLKTVACEAAMPPSTEDDTFEGVPLSEATLYVMEQSIKSYKAADRWKQFKWIKTLSGYLVNGIYYKILSEEQKTACVVAGPVKYIGNVVIEDCVMINGSAYTVAEIGSQAFYNCSEVSSVSLPKTITSIGSQAFYGCEKIAKIVLPDDITTIGSSAFNKNIHSHDDRETNIPVYVNRGTKSLLALWASGYTPYERGKSYSMLPAPVLSYSSTQTTVTLTIEHMTYQEYTYMLDSQVMSESRSIITGMKPEESGSATLRVSLDDFIGYTNRCDYKTADISPSVTSPIVTASSLSIKGSYIHGDAVVDSIWLDVDNKVYEGDSIFLSGLDPKSNHQAIFYVRVAYGDNYEYKTTYNSNRKSGWSTYVTTLTTEDISLVTQEPHVISYGNAVVSAQSNIDDIETNVGFEWRRTDWTEEFPSNVGVAYLFGGAMEGFIRNLNTEKLWKYRPYYESSSGKRYYGDWMGIDPTNTSYFEPIVRTYPEMQVKGNTARVYGYAMPGSESMLQQGFKYWKETNGSRAFVQDNNVNVPEYANTIVVNDIVMEAELTGLDYGNTYYYVAFVTTTDGKSFYGKVLTFQTDEDLTGIQTLTNSKTKEDNRCYDLNGRPINNPRKGLYIRKGKKVLVR